MSKTPKDVYDIIVPYLHEWDVRTIRNYLSVMDERTGTVHVVTTPVFAYRYIEHHWKTLDRELFLSTMGQLSKVIFDDEKTGLPDGYKILIVNILIAYQQYFLRCSGLIKKGNNSGAQADPFKEIES